MHILVVEDERRVASFLERGLRAEGYTITIARDGDRGARLAASEEVTLVVLDLRLPDRDGLSVLRDIRAAKPALPVLILTARDDVRSKVEGLNAGADDYLTKPFAFEELVARIRAHLRRQEERADVLRAGDLMLDLRARRVERGGAPVSLTPREFALLELFLRHPGQVLTRTQILGQVWRFEVDPASNVVDVYVRYLREKLDRPGSPAVIETVRGVGYRVAGP
jgi:two-component system, OmpR family, response regulator